MELKFEINLLPDDSVVTKDGEFLGTWESDGKDHPSFTPDGESEHLFFHPRTYRLCEMSEEWRQREGRV